MTRKSAASLKSAKVCPKETLEKKRKNFEQAKAVVLMTLDAQIKNCGRIDNLVDIWSELGNWKAWDTFGYPGFSDNAVNTCKEVVVHMVRQYECIKAIVETIEFDAISSDDWKDPFADMVPTADNVDGIWSMYMKYVTFRCVRPIGEKFEQIRSIIMEGNEANDR